VLASHPLLLLLPHQPGRRRGPRHRSCTPSICRRKVVLLLTGATLRFAAAARVRGGGSTGSTCLRRSSQYLYRLERAEYGCP
jgi:hypothetical protein